MRRKRVVTRNLNSIPYDRFHGFRIPFTHYHHCCDHCNLGGFVGRCCAAFATASFCRSLTPYDDYDMDQAKEDETEELKKSKLVTMKDHDNTRVRCHGHFVSTT
jgi:hypothetical protein